MMLNREIQGVAKNAGLSHPSVLASSAIGPKRESRMDLPIIQLTATGTQHEGQEKGDPEELARANVGVEQERQMKAIAY